MLVSVLFRFFVVVLFSACWSGVVVGVLLVFSRGRVVIEAIIIMLDIDRRARGLGRDTFFHLVLILVGVENSFWDVLCKVRPGSVGFLYAHKPSAVLGNVQFVPHS